MFLNEMICIQNELPRARLIIFVESKFMQIFLFILLVNAFMNNLIVKLNKL
jgi:hypothetical protein